jgi:hypothetical protein
MAPHAVQSIVWHEAGRRSVLCSLAKFSNLFQVVKSCVLSKRTSYLHLPSLAEIAQRDSISPLTKHIR